MLFLLMRLAPALLLLVTLSACLNPYGDPQDTEGTGTTTGASTTTGDATTTTTATTGDDPSTTSPTTGDAVCGDGLVQAPEECDLGMANADDGDCTADCKNAYCGDGLLNAHSEECDQGAANKDTGACTSSCKQATCGDTLLQEGVELCDDGVNDGMYGGCAVDCSAAAPRCGDGNLDADWEQCDSEPACMADTCVFATNCLDYKMADAMAPSGLYLIKRDGVADAVQVWCAMDDAVDGGGYTFLKIDVDSDVNDFPYQAKKAETSCAAYGMKLLIPRSKAHLEAAYGVAMSDALVPVGGGAVATGSDYLRILGIYPTTPGVSCVDHAINSTDCPEWSASDTQTYWVSAAPVGAGEPDPDGACAGCSMSYTWNLDGTVKKYVAIPDVGGSSFRFMCDTGNKLP
jgi:hypothetical protein